MITKNDFKLIKRALIYIKPYKFRFLLSFLCIIFGIIFGLIQPFLWAKVLANLFRSDYDNLMFLILYLLLLYFMQSLIIFLQSYLFSYLNQNIIYDIKRDMQNKIYDLPVKAFDEIGVGEFISRINGDAAIVANIITNQLTNALVDVLNVIIIGLFSFQISLPLALIVIILFPFSILISTKFGIKLRGKIEELAQLSDKYLKKLQESILGIREIKGLGIKKYNFGLVLLLSRTIKGKNIGISVLSSLMKTLAQGLNFLTQLCIISAGGYLILIKSLTVEYFITFSSYSSQLSSSLMNIVNVNSNLQQVLTSLKRIFCMIDNLNYSKERFGDKNIKELNGNIEITDIYFKYNEKTAVLNGITLYIPSKKKIAIVGGSGTGKTTIINLLARFYEPLSGEIKIDNIDIREFDEESLRSNISIVRQDPFLFNTSIKENLINANNNVSEDDMYIACKMAYIHDFISSLPNGYETIIGENGINLSGGQRQRIAIARALIKKSKIILFDEATSALDNESQYYINKVIDDLSKHSTILIVAHRLSTIIDADEIVVIDNGKIVGQGSHEILIETNEMYRQLYLIEASAINKY